MSNSKGIDPAADDDHHLDDLPDGLGCVEIWERLSEHRDDD